MYSVSEAYIEQMMKKGTRRRLSGTIGSVAFSGDDVVKESFSITGRATEESDTKIGGVYLGELNMTFLPSFLSKVARSEFEGKELSVSIGLWIPNPEDTVNGGSWTDVPCGKYTLEAPQISKEGIIVSGYDNMAKLDKTFNINVTTATPYQYLNYIAQECGVQIGNTEAEIELFPNGLVSLPLYSPNDIETYRDLLYWVAQACGCFACAGRDGKIYLRKFGNETNIEFDEDHRDTDVVFSAYTTRWTGVSFINIRTQETQYYAAEVDNGLTMNLGANPLLQIGTADEIDSRRRNVLNAVTQIQYNPFYMNSARDPIFDLGDEIPFTGGISDGCTGCIMAFSYMLTNYNYEGYGDNPALANARSKQDKNISGLKKNTAENEIIYYYFTNLDVIEFGSEVETRIARLNFLAIQKTTVKIMHEFIMDMIADLAAESSYEIHYYLDQELITYKPTERLGGIAQLSSGSNSEFTIARDFFYVLLDVEPNSYHTWEVKIITHGIEKTKIDLNHAHITLEGQRLYASDYISGLLEIEDELNLIDIGYMDVLGMQDSAQISFNVIVSYLLTDDGDNLCTDDGDRIILD